VQCEIDERVVRVSEKYLGDTVATSFKDPRVTLVRGVIDFTELAYPVTCRVRPLTGDAQLICHVGRFGSPLSPPLRLCTNNRPPLPLSPSTLHPQLFDDAAKYIAAHKDEFDVIIVDSSDPNEGPADSLFTPEFYRNLSEALKAGGIVCTQGECMWQNMDLIAEVLAKATDTFPVVDYAYTCVPTYPSGQIGFLVCSKGTSRESPIPLPTPCRVTPCYVIPPVGLPHALGVHARAAVYARSPKRAVPEAMAAKLRYYSHAMHAAAFALPRFAEDRLLKVRPPVSA